MKKYLIIVLLGLFSLSISAQDSGWGIGVIMGEPTGFAAKTWLSRNDALDAGVGWMFSRAWFHTHIDYLRHIHNVIPVTEGQFSVYFGAGPRFGIGKDFSFGARFPGGILYMFDSVDLDLFAEVVPGVQFVPRAEFEMGAGIGARWWF